MKEGREVQFSGQTSSDGTAKALKLARAWLSQITKKNQWDWSLAGKGENSERLVTGKKKPDHSRVYKTGPGASISFEGNGKSPNGFKWSNHPQRVFFFFF